MLALQGHAVAPGEGHSAGRALLKAMYEAQFGLAMPEIVLLQGGKPVFARSGVHFSITHTKHHVFCALSDRPIGIDAEELDREVDLRLAEKILSAPERARYDAAENKREALLRLWVLKEADAKRTGEGIRGYPNRTDFDPADKRIRVMMGCFVAAVE